MSSQTFVIQTRFGQLLAEWTDAHNLIVKSGDGAPLRVFGVAYGVRAYMHRDGCLQADSDQFARNFNQCWSHRNGENFGKWVYGHVSFGDERVRDGSIDSHTSSIMIGKGGQYYNGGASTAARRAIEQALMQGVEGLARTATSAPRQAEIENLQRDYQAALKSAARLREDAKAKDREATEILIKLAKLGVTELDVVAA